MEILSAISVVLTETTRIFQLRSSDSIPTFCLLSPNPWHNYPQRLFGRTPEGLKTPDMNTHPRTHLPRDTFCPPSLAELKEGVVGVRGGVRVEACVAGCGPGGVCHHVVWHLEQQRVLAHALLAAFKQREAADLQYAAAAGVGGKGPVFFVGFF